VTNPGPVPLAVGVDGRTPGLATMPLTPLVPAVTGDGGSERHVVGCADWNRCTPPAYGRL
jgi:hypothetical protein